MFEDQILDFWQDLFQVITLTEIMHQKDAVAFVELLNQMRVKCKGEALSEAGKDLHAQAINQADDCPKGILHVFATHKEVNQHNVIVAEWICVVFLFGLFEYVWYCFCNHLVIISQSAYGAFYLRADSIG